MLFRSSTTTPSTGTTTNRCGTSWPNANSNPNAPSCSNTVPCPSGQMCYAPGKTGWSTPAPVTGTTTPSAVTSGDRCAATWLDANNNPNAPACSGTNEGCPTGTTCFTAGTTGWTGSSGGGAVVGTGSAPPQGYNAIPCPAGQYKFANTPKNGVCSCGVNWHSAYSGGDSCGVSKPAPAGTVHGACPPGTKPYANTPNKGECACGADWESANTGTISCTN